MFADYRVPVVLRERGILVYAPALAAAVDGKQTLAPGSDEEVEIRAGTIVAVERLREAVQRRLAREAAAAGHQGGTDGAALQHQQPTVPSIAVDWWLWEEGERARASHRPHHRVPSTFY